MPEPEDPLVGTRLKDYILKSLLGRGAMGMVYLAEHTETRNKVAIKFLSGEFAMKEEFVKRFVNEAAACASLEHSNIIRVFEAGQEEGIHYMVMEYVDGVNLAHFLKSQDRVKESQAKPWLRQVAEALQYAHQSGIVHRDIKPENLMLTRKGAIKVADLGLSKNIEATENFSMTMSGTVIGTPYYISPEQIRNAKHVDTRTDMYSLGAAFYHLVTGVPPFDGDSAAEVMSKHMNEPLMNPQRRIASLSDAFCDVITHMMEKDPSQRFQTMEEVVGALDRIESGKSVIHQKLKVRKEGEQDSRVIAVHSYWRGKRWILAGTALLILLGVLLILPKPSSLTVSMPKLQEVRMTLPPSSSPPKAAVSIRKKEAESIIQREKALSESIPNTSEPSGSSVNNEDSQPGTIMISGGEKAGTEEEDVTTIKIGSGEGESGGSAPLIPSKIFYNWVDLLALLLVYLGVPMVRPLGALWGSVRALIFCVSVFIICKWFEPVVNWLHRDLSFPEGTSSVMGFAAVSIALLLPAWTISQRLRGHQKETWQLKLDQMVALIPSIIGGIAVSFWIIAFLAVTIPKSMPIDNSWVGNRLYEKFPSIRSASKMFNNP